MEAHPRSDVESYVNGKTHSHKAMKMLLNSPEATERSPARRLVSRILDQARGVFIWIELLLENLLDARTEGAELEELDDIVTSLPSVDGRSQGSGPSPRGIYHVGSSRTSASPSQPARVSMHCEMRKPGKSQGLR
jgi:hypothetical protein